MQGRYIKKIRGLNSKLFRKEKQQIKAQTVLELSPKYPLTIHLEEIKMSRGSYLCQLRKAPLKSIDAVYKNEIKTIKKIFSDSKERYGYRRVMYITN